MMMLDIERGIYIYVAIWNIFVGVVSAHGYTYV